MYLSKFFMQELRKSGVTVALLKSDTKLRERMEGIYEWDDCTKYFFETEGWEIVAPNENYEELMDFWKVYRTFDHEVAPQVKKELWIMQMLYETDMKKSFWENQKRKKTLSEKQKENHDFLMREIEKPVSKKYLVILRKNGKAFHACKKIDVENLDPAVFVGERALVENELMELFHIGGIAVLVVGRLGLTPQRFYAYAMKNETCRRCSEKKIESFKELILSNNQEAELKGRLAGCQDAYVDSPGRK